jgi:hypothetical protein
VKRYDPVNDSQRTPHQLRAAGEQETQLKWKAQHPLANGLFRQNLIDQQCGAFGHASDYLHRHHWDLLAMKAFYVAARCRQPMQVQFLCDALQAWVVIDAVGLSFGLGRREGADILVTSTIRELRETMLSDDAKMAPELQAFLACFNLPAAQVSNQSY